MNRLARAVELASVILGLNPSNPRHVKWIKEKFSEFEGDLNRFSEYLTQLKKEEPYEGRLDLPQQQGGDA